MWEDEQNFYHTQGLEELPQTLEMDCHICGFEWSQSYIPGVTDV